MFVTAVRSVLNRTPAKASQEYRRTFSAFSVLCENAIRLCKKHANVFGNSYASFHFFFVPVLSQLNSHLLVPTKTYWKLSRLELGKTEFRDALRSNTHTTWLFSMPEKIINFPQ